jgi:hypothetical protein
MCQETPSNQCFKAQPDDPKYPEGDVLNIAIRKLAETTPLKHLTLTGNWLVSPALFDGEKPFPHLEEFIIHSELITYDGRWYYTGNPSDAESMFSFTWDDDPESGDEDTYSSDSSSSSNHGAFVRPSESRDLALNGHKPFRVFRTQPDTLMVDPLMRTMAAAILRMPKLRKLLFHLGTLDGWGIAFECLRPGQSPYGAPFPALQKKFELGVSRCYMTVLPSIKWEAPKDVRSIEKQQQLLRKSNF